MHFCEAERKALVYNLKRQDITEGNYSKIFPPSLEVITEIAKWLHTL